jgi:hypothetical protein
MNLDTRPQRQMLYVQRQSQVASNKQPSSMKFCNIYISQHQGHIEYVDPHIDHLIYYMLLHVHSNNLSK